MICGRVGAEITSAGVRALHDHPVALNVELSSVNENPYQVANDYSQEPQQSNGYSPTQFYVDGSQIICGKEVMLPPVCVRTGEREDLVEVRRKAIYYVHPAVYVALIGGLIPLLILYMILRKKVVVSFYLSRRVRNRRMIGMVLGLVLFISSFFTIPVMAEMRVNEGVGLLAFIGMMFTGLILLLMNQSAITAKRHQNGSIFWLAGFKPAFFNTLRSMYRPNER